MQQGPKKLRKALISMLANSPVLDEACWAEHVVRVQGQV